MDNKGYPSIYKHQSSIRFLQNWLTLPFVIDMALRYRQKNDIFNSVLLHKPVDQCQSVTSKSELLCHRIRKTLPSVSVSNRLFTVFSCSIFQESIAVIIFYYLIKLKEWNSIPLQKMYVFRKNYLYHARHNKTYLQMI